MSIVPRDELVQTADVWTCFGDLQRALKKDDYGIWLDHRADSSEGVASRILLAMMLLTASSESRPASVTCGRGCYIFSRETIRFLRRQMLIEFLYLKWTDIVGDDSEKDEVETTEDPDAFVYDEFLKGEYDEFLDDDYIDYWD